MTTQPAVRFGVIGANHDHIYSQVNLMLNAGAELVAFYVPEAELAAPFAARYPQAVRTADAARILEDDSLQLVVSAAVPARRAPLGIEVMRHGKDYMVDKPAFTSLAQLAAVRQVQAESGQIYSVCYSERFENRASVKALELVQTGAVGRVIQTSGFGPHRRRLHTRPPWFFQREQYGGILCDIGSHQFDQYLAFTGASEAEIVAAQVANYHHPEHPQLEDFGDVLLRSPGCSGYIRVDWFTPDGLETWGDGRLLVLGTEGYLEARKYVDLAGRPGGDHIFLVDRRGTHYVDCGETSLPYGRQLVHDILHRTETAMTQVHCFLASELALTAQAQAARLGHLHP